MTDMTIIRKKQCLQEGCLTRHLLSRVVSEHNNLVYDCGRFELVNRARYISRRTAIEPSRFRFTGYQGV